MNEKKEFSAGYGILDHSEEEFFKILLMMATAMYIRKQETDLQQRKEEKSA